MSWDKTRHFPCLTRSLPISNVNLFLTLKLLYGFFLKIFLIKELNIFGISMEKNISNLKI